MAKQRVKGKQTRRSTPRCKVCGCTQTMPCDPPCGWSDIEANLCTGCEDAADALVEWELGALRPNWVGLVRVVAERIAAQSPHTPLARGYLTGRNG